jgi:ABC-type transport system involved in multi-copper enzyme maturation permease subunit
MSRALTIARNDFRHALRDRLVWGAVVLLGVMFLPSVGAGSPPLREHLLSMMAELVTFSLVVVAAVGYNSITGDRAEGVIRLVLGLPGTRRDVVLGKFIARLAIVALALGLVLVVACIQTVRTYGLESLGPFWVMGGWMLVYGVVWTAITIGYSAAFSSQYRTLGALVATYALFTPALSFWGVFVHPIFAFVFTGSFSLPNFESLADAPSWFYLMLRLNPIQGFAGMVRWSVSMVTGQTPVIGFGFNLTGTSVFIALGLLVFLGGLGRFERADLVEDKRGPNWSTRLRPTGRVTSVTVGIDLPRVSLDDRFRIGTIARGDLSRALKGWVLHGVVVLFVLIVLPLTWSTLSLSTKGTFLGVLSDSLSYAFFLPVLVLGTATGYRSVVGERESDTIRYALGLPGTRRDLVVGKLIARTGIVAGVIVAVLVLTEAIVLVRLGRPHLVSFLVGAAWVLLVGVVWTTFVVGVSSAVSSSYRALAVILGVYLLFSTDNGLWGAVVRPLMGLVFTGQFSSPTSAHTANKMGPVWFQVLDGLSPFVALRRILLTLQTATGSRASNITVPLVLYSVGIVFVFVGCTFYFGYRRFERTDLG